MPAVPNPAPGGPSERGVSANSDPDPRAGVASVSRLQRQPQRCRTEGSKNTHIRSGRCRCKIAQKARPSRNEVVMLVMLTSR